MYKIYNRTVVCVGVCMDSVLDGFVEDILGLFSCSVHSWLKSRSSMYQMSCLVLWKMICNMSHF